MGERQLEGLYSRKGLWLFALLALRAGKEVDRAWLAATLWPDTKEATGLFYLRRELSGLRKALGEEAARLTSPVFSMLRLDLSGVEFDVVAFDQAAAQMDQEDLERAVGLYGGPLLEGCAEEWAAPERQIRELAYTGALETLAEMALTRSDPQAAIPMLRRLVLNDPLRESAHRSLIRALAAKGDLAAARKVFRDLRIMLRRELNAEPGPETLDLVSRIRADLKQKAIRVAQKLEGGEEGREGSLPQPLTSLVGRATERDSIIEMLAVSRLVTLTGTGGVGKTRLALEVAERIKESIANGAWFVDLSAITDAKLIGQGIAAVLEIRDVPGRSIDQVLSDRLQSRQLLIVLDNCEQVIEGAAGIVERLLQKCAGLKVLATSRQSLGITGESTFRVPSLDTPPDSDQSSADRAGLNYDSVRLFMDRASQASNGFSLSAENSADVAHICRRLGGIPLAIELAAARVRSLPVREIAERLDDRFAFLAGGIRSGAIRQQTLRASVDWSYDLLSEEEQGLFRGLSVFAGGFKLRHAEVICQDGQVSQIQHLLSELVDKSLVFFDEWIGRYSLLETMRQYSNDLQRERNETTTYRDRHLAYFLALAEEAEPHLIGAEQQFWLDCLEEEHDNIRNALRWSIEGNRRHENGLRLAAAISRFWNIRGHNREGRDWLVQLLSLEPEGQDLKIRSKALGSAGMLASDQGDASGAEIFFDEDIAILKMLGDRRGLAHSLNNKANLSYYKGDCESERTLREECLAIWRELDDPWGIALALGNLGWTAYTSGDYFSACTLQEQSLAIRRELGLQRGIANSLHLLGVSVQALGDLPAARALLQESLSIQREVGWSRGVAVTLRDLGNLSFEEGDYRAARSSLDEGLAICSEIGDRFFLAGCLELSAQISAAQGEAIRAAQIWGATEQLREENGLAVSSAERTRLEQHVASARALLEDDAAFENAWQEGRAMAMERAIELALEGNSS